MARSPFDAASVAAVCKQACSTVWTGVTRDGIDVADGREFETLRGPAPIDDRSDRSPVDIVEPATDQPEALRGEVHDGGCVVDALPLMGLVLFLPSFASDMCVPAGDRGGAIIALPVKR